MWMCSSTTRAHASIRIEATEDGLERTFATNHLGHFLLTSLLMDHLRAAPSARIITVSSSAHRAANDDGIWSYQGHEYDRRQAYAKSKLANILFAFELARRLQGTRIVSNAVDPGVVSTNFARNNGLLAWAKHTISHGLRGELVSAARAADTIVYLATSCRGRRSDGSAIPGAASDRTIPSGPRSAARGSFVDSKRRPYGT